jgi:cell division protein FtsB
LFDLRYHIASLAAVFLALIIGILVGVGISARTDVEASERRLLEQRNADLQQRVSDLSAEADLLRRQRDAADAYTKATYRAVMDGRLRGIRVALLFVGQVDENARVFVQQTLDDGSAPGLVRMRALELPVDAAEMKQALEPQFSRMSVEEIGRRLGEEFVEGGETPVWDALTPVIVEDDRGTGSDELDAVVVSHTVVTSKDDTQRLIDGLYAGLAAKGVPAVGIERTEARPSRIPVYRTNGISSVDSVDTQVGRVALAVLLAGAGEGHYGLKRTAEHGVLPRVEPLPLAPPPGG